MEIFRKYGVQADFYFPLIKAGEQNFALAADFTHSAGDTKISKDGAAAANTTNAPTAIVMGNAAMWKLTLTATEMEAALIAVTISDAATKAVEDQMIIINTYGNASGQHAFDLDTATQPVNVTQLGGAAQSLTDLKDFADDGYDPATNKVEGVKVVDTTTANTDMRGTDNALLAASAPGNFGDLAITATTGRVTVGTNNDKSGYSISGTKTTLDALNDVSAADVKGEADQALVDIHLNYLLAVSYNPASPPGNAGSWINELSENDGSGNIRYTVKALEQAPTGGSAPTVAQIADGVWDELTTGHVGAGSFGAQLKTVVDTIDSSTGGLAGAAMRGTDGASTHSAADVWTVGVRTVTGGTIDTNNDMRGTDGASTHSAADVWTVPTRAVTGGTIDTNNDMRGTDGAATPGAAMTLTVAERNDAADALLNRDMAAVPDTNSRSPLNAFRLLRNKYSISGVTLTVTKENDTTTAWTATLTTDATADPITGSDPA